MNFTKMQGCGNDYVYINGFTEKIKDKVAFVKAVSDRHFGVGSDGAIFINPSDVADFEMEMYNADGSRSEMCGNGIRCVAKYVYDHGMTDKEVITVVSAGKIKTLALTVEDGKVSMVKVNMGAPILEPEAIPVVCEGETCINRPIEVDGVTYHMTCVSMGNPHSVVFLNAGEDAGKLQSDNVKEFDLDGIGAKFECHERFPRRVNAEFVEILNDEHVNMRVYERGTGETLACGTGSCAVTVACILNGFTKRKITVSLPGGDLIVEWDEKSGDVFMTGPAETVFEGQFPWEDTK